MRRKIHRCFQGTVSAEVQSGSGWLNDHGHKRPLVRWNHQAGDECIGRATPPVNQLAGVAAEIATISETSVAATALEQTAVVGLVAVRVDPTGHRHSVGVEVQWRQSYPRRCGGDITKAGGDCIVGGGKSWKCARSRT